MWWEAVTAVIYHGNGSPRRGVVFTGVNADIPAGLKNVNDWLHANIELRHPRHLHVALRLLYEAHLSARLQRNPCKKKELYNI